MRPGEFLAELIGIKKGLFLAKKALFLQTKGYFAKQSRVEIGVRETVLLYTIFVK